MFATIHDHNGQVLTETCAMVVALAAVIRKECVQTGPSTFQVLPNRDHLCQPVLTPLQKRRIFLAQERKKENN